MPWRDCTRSRVARKAPVTTSLGPARLPTSRIPLENPSNATVGIPRLECATGKTHFQNTSINYTIKFFLICVILPLLRSCRDRERDKEREKPRQMYPEILDIPHDARDCGILSWRPLLIQRFSSIKVSTIKWDVLGMFMGETHFTPYLIRRCLYFSFRSWSHCNKRWAPGT